MTAANLSEDDLNQKPELLSGHVYRVSREGIKKQLKHLQTKLSRAPHWQTMKRETLGIKIEKLKAIRNDLRLVIHIAEGTTI